MLVDVAYRDGGLETVDLDAAQLLGVVGAEAARRADLIESILVGAALVEEVPHVLAVKFVRGAAHRAHVAREALLEPSGQRAVGHLSDDHDGAVGVVGDAVGGRAEQIVAEEVAAVADDDQVVAVGLGVVGDDLGGVAGHEGDFVSTRGLEPLSVLRPVRARSRCPSRA